MDGEELLPSGCRKESAAPVGTFILIFRQVDEGGNTGLSSNLDAFPTGCIKPLKTTSGFTYIFPSVVVIWLKFVGCASHESPSREDSFEREGKHRASIGSRQTVGLLPVIVADYCQWFDNNTWLI